MASWFFWRLKMNIDTYYKFYATEGNICDIVYSINQRLYTVVKTTKEEKVYTLYCEKVKGKPEDYTKSVKHILIKKIIE
jgi:hypothetical protein